MSRSSASHKKIWLFLLVLAATCIGCRTLPCEKALNAEYYWGRESRLKSELSPEFLCKFANDPTMGRYYRCLAMAGLFATHVKIGFTSMDMRQAIPANQWLNSCTIDFGGGSGGQVSILKGMGRSIFVLRLLPDNTGWSEWVIDLALTRDSGHPRTCEEALAFLRGEHPDKRMRLEEFVLKYPLSEGDDMKNVLITERFTKKGVGICF